MGNKSAVFLQKIWRKIDAEEMIPQFISVDFDVTKTNSG